MIAKVTAPELARDLASAELQLSTHEEYTSEVEVRIEAINRFIRTGNDLIANGHFLAEDIQDKVHTISQRLEVLQSSSKRRKEIYEQNLDAQKFEQEASQLEAWIQTREKLLQPDELGASIAEVEEFIRRHEDFQKTIEAQEENANGLRRITLVSFPFILGATED
jgi:uncharacterized protein YoxC